MKKINKYIISYVQYKSKKAMEEITIKKING